jgi:phosphopantothenoylcysteine synthetase/decarboxylase
MNIIVTCGPSFEPIDRVRRLTNFSTGELGARLSRAMARAGFEVLCFMGSGATHPVPGPPCRVIRFDTNGNLLALLKRAGAARSIAAVFHVAALCDYRVTRVTDARGRQRRAPKIASRAGSLILRLEPATKVISRLRRLFPASILVGWKYELSGTRTQALNRAARQIQDYRTDACVLNGRAYGNGFAVCQSSGRIRHCRSRSALVRFLVAWLKANVPPPARRTGRHRRGANHLSGHE